MVVSTNQFSICVFLLKQGAKLKGERVCWLSKIWVLYFMTDEGSNLSFFISGLNNTPVFSSQFFSSDSMGYVHWHHLP